MKILELAGHRLSVSGQIEEEILSSMPEMHPFLREGEDFEWHISYGENVVLPEFEACHEFDFEDCKIHCLLGVEEESMLFEMEPASGTKLSMRYDGGNTIVASCAGSITLLRYSLWISTAMFGMKQGLQPVHSAVVVHHGKAVLCLGESGTGKSTHTRLWLKHIEDSHLLNDDSPLITSRGEVFGSPWSGKTACYIDRHFPIAAIVRLSQAPENKIRQLNPLEAIAALQPSLPPSLSYTHEGLDAQLDLISELLTRVRFYHLSCLPDQEAAELCCKAIFGEE